MISQKYFFLFCSLIFSFLSWFFFMLYATSDCQLSILNFLFPLFFSPCPPKNVLRLLLPSIALIQSTLYWCTQLCTQLFVCAFQFHWSLTTLGSVGPVGEKFGPGTRNFTICISIESDCSFCLTIWLFLLFVLWKKDVSSSFTEPNKMISY